MWNITLAAFTFTIISDMGCAFVFYKTSNSIQSIMNTHLHSVMSCKIFFTCILSRIVTCFLLHSFDSINSCKIFFNCIVPNFASCILLHSYIVTSLKCFFTCISSQFAESFTCILQFCQFNSSSLHSVECFIMFSLALLHSVIIFNVFFT